jgi:predicted glycoside hydrolase/deacetylase ChbG (UPF0249 family)
MSGSTAADAARPQPRPIWLCADDYGISPGVNRAIRELAARRRLNATSVMVVAPSFSRSEAEALAGLSAQAARPAIGLHLTLTAPFHPLSAGFAPLRNGAFLPLPSMLRAALLRRLKPDCLLAEVRAQIAAFCAAFGQPPDFVDGHQHVHLFPQVREAVVTAVPQDAPEAWLRQCGQPQQARKWLVDPKGLLIHVLSRELRRRAAKLGIATNPAFAGTYSYSSSERFTDLFPRFLKDMPAHGLIMCHPGFADSELRRLDRLIDRREEEYAYFAGEAFPQVLAARHITLA